MSIRPDDPVPLFDPARLAEVKPTAAAILLGQALRRLREERRLTVKMAAKLINASTSKLSRLERAESPPDERDVAALAAKYGVSADDRTHLLFVARRALEPEWFHRYSDCTGTWMHRLMALEAEAIELSTYEMKIVPGLIQDDSYARQIISNGLRVSEGDEVEQRIHLRRERQKRFFDQSQPPQGIFLLDESILFRQVGCRRTMRAQMHKLLQLFDAANVSIRIVPLDSSIVSNHGSMTHLLFGASGLQPMVYIEGNDDATYCTKEDVVERHVELMLRLGGEAAFSRRESRSMLQAAVERYSD